MRKHRITKVGTVHRDDKGRLVGMGWAVDAIGIDDPAPGISVHGLGGWTMAELDAIANGGGEVTNAGDGDASS